jgi:predicted  nucleic acid-binding Zn-ribbon protein
MPDLVCSECGHAFFDRSQLALMQPCPECGEDDTLELDDYDPGPVESAAPEPNRIAVAQAAAARLLDEHNLTEPPIDVESLAGKLGLSVERRALGDQSGELRGTRIIVNRDHPSVRQRFTIAHEIGHFVLHTDHCATAQIERQADAFAAALLIPSPILARAVRETPRLAELKRHFDVSEPAMTIAVQDAGLTRKLEQG